MRLLSLQPRVSVVRLLLTLLLLAVMGGCLPADLVRTAPTAELEGLGQDTSRLSCFLSLKDSRGPAIRLTVDRVEVLANDVWLPLNNAPLLIDSAAIGAGQLFLGGQRVTPGNYQRLRLQVSKGEVQKADGKYVTVAEKPFAIDINFGEKLLLEAEDSRCLLVTWDVEGSMGSGDSLRPLFTATTALRQLSLDLVFVSCPDIDTVFVVRTDKNWVVDSFGVTGGPTSLAIDPISSRQRLYVLAARDRKVKVIDLSTYRMMDFFQVTLNDVPSYMTLGPGGEEVFLLDERSGYLSRMSLLSGQTLGRTLLGHRPGFMLYQEEQNLLAVSLSLSQKVVLLDPRSLVTLGTLSTGNTPTGLLAAGNRLYVAESGDDTVSVIDLSTRSTQSTMAVGFNPRRLLAGGNQIFVSNYQDDSLSVLIPEQLGVIQEIPDLRGPQEMAVHEFQRRLYVAEDQANSLAVVDTNSNLLVGHIALGGRPFGLAVIQ